MSWQTLELSLRDRRPVLWLNPRRRAIEECRRTDIRLRDVQNADARLRDFASPLMELFPELRSSGGIIESPLIATPSLQLSMAGSRCIGRWYVKADHDLPVAGSIKARGGIYEVLAHAERLMDASGIAAQDTDRSIILSPRARECFGNHSICVGSTGNLGLSIGVIGAALGFQVTVHMSSIAKAWKKDRLRAKGVRVVEHAGDFGAAVAAGRESARTAERTYFVDDENSRDLFLGYSVAALRLGDQLARAGIRVDASNPLLVYLPCGVGGGPGGITFGLRHVFGDHVHCFLAEPAASPAMLARLAHPDDRPISVAELDLDNHTEADGLAVGRASEYAAMQIRELVSGVYTVTDDELFRDLYRLHAAEGISIEPSAAAGLRGPHWLLNSSTGRQYCLEHGLDGQLGAATHLIWTTGGSFVPAAQLREFVERGRLSSPGAAP